MPVVGAATPVTCAGALALMTAEIIACNAIALAVDKRLCGWAVGPVFFDMKAAIHTQAGPELWRLSAAASHMASFLFGRPYRATVAFATSACVPGLQSMTEHALAAAWNFANGARSFGGLGTLAHADVGSTVQLMLDLEIVRWMRHAAKSFVVDLESLAEETILEVAPKGAYFLDTDHTARHFRRVSWFPELMDRRVPGAWRESPHDMLEAARKQALDLEKSAPNRCPLSHSQKQAIHRILAETDRRFGEGPGATLKA
jgi:trimethylamine:corrinoid methyltransferase-like protein